MTRVPGGPQEAGFTLIELLVGSAVAGVLAAGALVLLHASGQVLRAHMEALSGAESARVVSTTLPSDLRFADPADIVGAGVDSLALRAIRGVAIVCAVTPGAFMVRYRGLRQPNPDKDSVRFLDPRGGADRLAALGSDADGEGGCPAHAGESIRRWSATDTVGRPGDILLLFERGTYAFTGDALRYRRGAAGRQPLTEEVIPAGRFVWTAGPGSVRVDFETASGRSQPSRQHRASVRLRNGPARPRP